MADNSRKRTDSFSTFMEPMYHDGQIVSVQKEVAPIPGDIGSLLSTE